MKIKLNTNFTWQRGSHDWICMLTPTVSIMRGDVFAAESAYWVILHWLIFRAYIRITTEKKEK